MSSTEIKLALRCDLNIDFSDDEIFDYFVERIGDPDVLNDDFWHYASTEIRPRKKPDGKWICDFVFLDGDDIERNGFNGFSLEKGIALEKICLFELEMKKIFGSDMDGNARLVYVHWYNGTDEPIH